MTRMTRTSTVSAARLRAAALIAAPVLALSVACDDGTGTRVSDEVASVPDDGGGKAAKKEKGTDSGGKSAFYDAQLKYVRCMRTKGGVKDFPDPRLSGYLDWDKIDAVTDPNGKGEEQKGGKGGACVPELREAMNLEPKRDAQKDYESMLAHAQCMREHGVSKFTNPTMSGGNVQPGGDPGGLTPGIDRDSPAYKKAREACEGKLLEGLDGMQ